MVKKLTNFVKDNSQISGWQWGVQCCHSIGITVRGAGLKREIRNVILDYLIFRIILVGQPSGHNFHWKLDIEV